MAQKARPPASGRPASGGKVKAEKYELPFTKKNYLWLGIGILIIVIGYIALGSGSITLAPILLVLGYCVIIPIAILLNGRKSKTELSGSAGKEISAPEVRK